MPNLSGIPAIDVAIGLAFMFFLLSIVCSSVNEGIAQILRLRARTLERGLVSILSDDEEAHRFYQHWRVKALMRPATKVEKRALRMEKDYAARHRRTGEEPVEGHPHKPLPRVRRGWLKHLLFHAKPSYLPSRVFALTVLDLYDGKDKDKEEAGDIFAQANAVLASDRVPDAVKVFVRDALRETTTDAVKFRRSLERSFDEVMDRASGWYKRRVQAILFVIAVALALAINADSFAIGQRLWQDDALRATVVAQATQTGQDPCSSEQGGNTPADKAVKCLDTIDQLKLPLGWQALPKGVDGYLSKLIGVLITAFALTLGAPFWFDLLGKVARLRGSGPTTTPPAAGKAPRADQATTERS